MATALATANAKAQADRQLSHGLKSISELKETTYALWKQEVEIYAFHAKWPKWILGIDPPNDADPSTWTEKEVLDSANAYNILMNKTKGTHVALDLAPPDLPIGDARAGYNIVEQYYCRTTPAGERDANKALLSSSMKVDNTDIIEFVANLRARRQRVKQMGGRVDDKMMRSILCDGLIYNLNRC